MTAGERHINGNGESSGERNPEIALLSKSVILTTVAYDKWLRETSNGKDFVIDGFFYRPPRLEQIEPINQQEALGRFGENIERINSIGLGNLPPEWCVVRASQQALKVYIEEQQRLARGEPKSPYRELLLAVSGFEPQFIPQAILDQNLETVVEVLRSMGEQFDGKNEESIRRAIRRRNEETKLQTPREVESVLKRSDSRNRVRLSRALGEDLSVVNFSFIWEEEDAFWRFWEVIGPDRDMLRANWHERHRSKYTYGLSEMYGRHEPAHFILGHLIRKEIRRGNIDPAAGLLVIPGPACYQLEGLAQTVGDLAGFEETVDGRLAVELYRLEKRTLANALLMIEDGDSIDTAAGWMRRYVPTNTLDENRRLLREGTTRVFERAYLPVYGRSDYDLMQLRNRLGDGVKSFLRYWFTRPLTRKQLLNPPVEQLISYES